MAKYGAEGCKISLLASKEDLQTPCTVGPSEEVEYPVVQVNGQRIYGPLPGWEGPPPPRDCEVFVGKIPRDMNGAQLVILFKRVGTIYEFRLMMEYSGYNRGFAFVLYANREAAQRAIQMLDNYEIRPGTFIGVCMCLNNCRLHIGSIPEDKKKDEIMEELRKVTDGVVDVMVYPCSIDETKNQGFAFVEYNSHKAAAMARKKLKSEYMKLWGQSIYVNWATPKKEVIDGIMQRVRVIHVRNLMLSTTEETLLKEFCFKPDCVERVKKLKNYAFIHYRCHDDAVTALKYMNGVEIDGATVRVSLAKPAGIKDRNASGRRFNSREAAEEEGNGFQSLHQSDGGVMGGPVDGYSPQRAVTLPCRLGNSFYPGAAPGDDLDGCVFPLLPGTPLSPISLQALEQSQVGSAVTLLELYCCKNHWSQPDYHLYSTPGPDGKPLLLCKVVIPTTHSIYTPDKLCVLLDDAKELAAQTTLWNLGSSFLSGPSSPSPPLTIPPSATSPGLLNCTGRAFASYLPPPAPTSPFPLSSLSTLTPLISRLQRLYDNSQSPFY